MIEELDADELNRRRRRRLLVDARDRGAAGAALIAAGYAVSTGADGTLQLSEERAIAQPEAIARLLVRADLPPTHLSGGR